MTAATTYDRATFAAGLRAVGLDAGMVVFSHANVGFFGMPAEGRTAQAVFDVILGAFLDVLGPEGTLVVPTFTYSFARGQAFCPEDTPSTCGMFAEMLRRHPGAVRSDDPNYSVAAIGGQAEALTRDLPEDSFGPDSFFDRFLHQRGVVCNLNFDAGSTFIHYVEKRLGVPYRYDKEFTGEFRSGGVAERRCSVISVQDLGQPATVAAFAAFSRLAQDQGLLRTQVVGRGSIVAITAEDTVRLVSETLPRRPWLLTKADGSEPPDVAPLVGPAPIDPPAVAAAADPAALAEALAAALRPLRRQGVGPGVEAALSTIATILPLAIHRIPTGKRIGPHLVPERWRPLAATVTGADGTVIEAQPATHSRPFAGRVTRSELLDHLVGSPAASVLGENRWALHLPGGYPVGEAFDVDIATEQRFGALAYGLVDAPLLLACDLGGDDGNAAAATVAAYHALGDRLAGRVGLLLHPRPFTPAALAPGATLITLPAVTGGPAAMAERLVEVIVALPH